MPTVGERIKELRVEILHMSVDEFARMLDLHRTTVYRYEEKGRDMPISVAIKIAETFNISLDWLAGLSDVMERNTAAKKQIAQIVDTLSPQGQAEVLNYAMYIKSKEGNNG